MSSDSPTQANKAQPLYIAAAIAVIIFAAIGSANMLGWLPGNPKEPPPAPQAVAVTPPEQPLSPPTTAAPVAQPPATVAPAAKVEATKKREKSPPHRTEGVAAPAKVCANCGVISAVRAIEQPGEATGLGAVAGGVAGALIGSQIGQGRGTTAAEIAGAAGGAYAGHQVEKNYRKTKRYEIDVRMEDGTRRVISQSAEPALNVGDKVRIIDGQLELY